MDADAIARLTQVLRALDQTAQVITHGGWSGWCPTRLGDLLRDAAPSDAVAEAAEKWLLTNLAPTAASLTAWERRCTQDDVLRFVEDGADLLYGFLSRDGVAVEGRPWREGDDVVDVGL